MSKIIDTAKNLYNDMKEASSYNMTKSRSSKGPDDWFTQVGSTEVPLEKKLKVYNEYKNAPIQYEKDGVKHGSFVGTRADGVPVDFNIEMQKIQNNNTGKRMPGNPKIPDDAVTDAQVRNATHRFGYGNDPRTVYKRYRNWKSTNQTTNKNATTKSTYKGNISL